MKRRKEGNEFERPSPPPSSSSSSSSSSVIETTRNDVFNIYILLFFPSTDIHSCNKNISLSERGKIADTLDYVD
jgi:hypothetical protein